MSIGEEERMRAELSRLATGAADQWRTANIGYDHAQTSESYMVLFDILTAAAFEFAKTSPGAQEQKLTMFAKAMRTLALN